MSANWKCDAANSWTNTSGKLWRKHLPNLYCMEKANKRTGILKTWWWFFCVIKLNTALFVIVNQVYCNTELFQLIANQSHKEVIVENYVNTMFSVGKVIWRKLFLLCCFIVTVFSFYSRNWNIFFYHKLHFARKINFDYLYKDIHL